jgi:hypothetical protein
LTLTILATFALAGAAVATAGVSESVPTNLKMRNKAPAFHGKVASSVPDCQSDRRVKLFYSQNGKGLPPQRTLLGRTNSDFKGRWFIDGEPLVSGLYFAKAKQHIINVDGVLVRCEPDFSRSIFVD